MSSNHLRDVFNTSSPSRIFAVGILLKTFKIHFHKGELKFPAYERDKNVYSVASIKTLRTY